MISLLCVCVLIILYPIINIIKGNKEHAETSFYYDEYLEEYQNNEFGRDQYIRAGIVQLCVLVLRSFCDAGIMYNAADLGQCTPIQQAILYIRDHYRGPISVEEVAKIVHLTPNYFSEYFRKQTGVKFSSYVQKMRLEFAASLLQQTDLSIKQVAEASGFNSAAYFSNAFKDGMGVSPELFRKNSIVPLSEEVTTEKE